MNLSCLVILLQPLHASQAFFTSGSALAAYTLIQKNMEMRTNIIAPQNMHQRTLLMGLPPRRGEPTMTIVVDAVPDEEEDKENDCAGGDEPRHIIVKLILHQHVCIL